MACAALAPFTLVGRDEARLVPGCFSRVFRRRTSADWPQHTVMPLVTFWSTSTNLQTAAAQW